MIVLTFRGNTGRTRSRRSHSARQCVGRRPWPDDRGSPFAIDSIVSKKTRANEGTNLSVSFEDFKQCWPRRFN